MNKPPIILSFFCILLFSLSVNSQNVDNLIVLLDSKDMDERFKAYMDISIANLLTNPKEAIKYAGQGLDLATKEENIYYKGSFLGIIGFAYYAMSDIANHKELKLVSKKKKDTFVFADKEMISIVIGNSLSNAIKFTPRNGKINISATQKIDNITIAVSDTGIGIPENELKDLFKTGTKYKQPGTENEQGTGLGLILCKEFVEKNDGGISVQRQIDIGSVFKFWLPV